MAKGSGFPMMLSGMLTSVVAASQIIFCIIGLLQFYCSVDVLRGLKTFLFIKVLYYNNPQCGDGRIYPGEIIPEMPNQSMILTVNMPITTSRNFIITCVYLPVSILWLLFSVMLVIASSKKTTRICERALWISITGMIVIMDIIVVSFYATDIEFTKTSTALVRYVGATISGAGNVVVDTKLAAILMTVIYLRFGVFFITNIFLLVWILIDTGKHTDTYSWAGSDASSGLSSGGFREAVLLPRVNILKRLPSWLGGRPPMKTFSYEEYEAASRPQRLANLMAERRLQLVESIIDTSVRYPPKDEEEVIAEDHVGRSIVDIHQPSTSYHDHTARRGTAAELQGQLPWSYIPPSAHRMRDNLPEDEDLPPVPVPDYTLHPKYRKASVHRAGSSVSTLKPKPLTGLSSDVLY